MKETRQRLPFLPIILGAPPAVPCDCAGGLHHDPWDSTQVQGGFGAQGEQHQDNGRPSSGRTMRAFGMAWGAILALVAMLLVPGPVLAQAGYGAISGTVQDPTGAVVPSVSITVTNVATNVTTRAVSTSEGRYMALQLPPGSYSISAEAGGFKKYLSSGIVVQVDDKLIINISLQLGSSTETVTVTGEAPALRTEDAQTGEVVNNTFIQSLPLIDRSPLDLLRISGNVQSSRTDGVTDNNTRINGGRSSGVDFFIDGAATTSGRGHSMTNETPSMDAVQEFKVVTGGISAEYGHLSGGYVEVVTKSGSNSYHGTAYEYMYNDMFNANSWYQNAIGNRKVHFRQNDFGFTLGGPVVIPKIYNGKNKTFFFVDNEYLKYSQGGSESLISVPTQAERNGDMSASLYNNVATMMYDPNGSQSSTPNADGTYSRLDLLGGDGKTVPASQIDPTSAAIEALLPTPNRTSTSGYSSLNNYGAPKSTIGTNFRLGVRLDQVINDNQKVAIRYSHYSSDFGTTRVGGPLFTSSATQYDGGLNAGVNYDWTYKPTLLFNLRGSVIHTPALSGAALPDGFNSSSIKFPAELQAILGTGTIPNIYNLFNSQYYANAPSANVTVSTTYDMAATGTKVLNRHTIKFGWESRRYYDNFSATGGGTIWFDSNPTAATTTDHGGGTNPQNAMGSYLLGINDWNTVTGPTTRAMNVNYNAAFVQDDFKVTPKLTVNIGVRWDREGPTTERHDKLYFWDQKAASLFTINPGWSWTGALADAGLPSSIPAPSWVSDGMPNGAIQIPNTTAFPSRNFQNISSHQFAPRLGLAYQLDSKTVLRASGGLMYIPTTGDAGGYASSNESLALGNAGNAGWHTSTDGQRHFLSTWKNPFPIAGEVTTYSRDTLLANQQSSNDPGVGAFGQNSNMPKEYTWMASVQRELPAGWVAEVGYSGNRGNGLLAPNLISHYPANLFTPAYSSAMTTSVVSPQAGQTLQNTITGPTQLLGILEYPYPQYGPVNLLGQNMGSSFFNAFNLRIEHRMSHGLMFLLNYTYSRLLDDVGGPEADTTGGMGATGSGGKMAQSIYNFQSTWGLSANDQTHRLVLTYVYALPIGKGKQWLNSPSGLGQKLLERAIGGWQFSGNSTWVSGLPVSFANSQLVNINNVIKVEDTYTSYATSNHNLGNSAYKGDNGALASPSANPASLVGRFASSLITPVQMFTAGDMPAMDPHLRNPAFMQTDLSLMKNFYLGTEQTRYLQIRGEAQNALNIRGFGSYNTTFGSPYFGLITDAGNTPRSIQVSARIIF
jgi:hypothetical protein